VQNINHNVSYQLCFAANEAKPFYVHLFTLDTKKWNTETIFCKECIDLTISLGQYTAFAYSTAKAVRSSL